MTTTKLPPPRVRIDADAMKSVLAAHKAAATGRAEPCGLLLGNAGDGVVRIQEVKPLQNVHQMPDIPRCSAEPVTPTGSSAWVPVPSACIAIMNLLNFRPPAK